MKKTVWNGQVDSFGPVTDLSMLSNSLSEKLRKLEDELLMYKVLLGATHEYSLRHGITITLLCNTFRIRDYVEYDVSCTMHCETGTTVARLVPRTTKSESTAPSAVRREEDPAPEQFDPLADFAVWK